MAPRRGGGSGGSGGSSSISCSSSAFDTEYARIEIAFAALYLVVYLVLWFLASIQFARSRKHGQPVAGSIALTISIFFATVAQIAKVVFITLNECGTTSPANSYPASLVALWLQYLSQYLLTAVILVPLCRRLQTIFVRVQKPVLIFQAVWAGLLVALLLAYLGISTAISVYLYGDGPGYAGEAGTKIEDLREPQRGVMTTYCVLALVGIIIASATMAQALAHAPSLRSRDITTWTTILSLSALGYTATVLGGWIQTAFTITTIETQSEIDSFNRGMDAVIFLTGFFYALAFYAALRVGSYRVAPTVSQPPVYEPGYDQGYRPGPEQGFTYQNQIR
ncbi:hypothetical protein BDW62DRAFT_187395 [Aspergillus aurantiobrunneus]